MPVCLSVWLFVCFFVSESFVSLFYSNFRYFLPFEFCFLDFLFYLSIHFIFFSFPSYFVLFYRFLHFRINSVYKIKTRWNRRGKEWIMALFRTAKAYLSRKSAIKIYLSIYLSILIILLSTSIFPLSLSLSSFFLRKLSQYLSI